MTPSEAAAIGGHAVVAKYGRAHMRRLARKSGGGRPRLRTLAEIQQPRASRVNPLGGADGKRNAGQVPVKLVNTIGKAGAVTPAKSQTKDSR